MISAKLTFFSPNKHLSLDVSQADQGRLTAEFHLKLAKKVTTTTQIYNQWKVNAACCNIVIVEVT